jgi:hypothetical protein
MLRDPAWPGKLVHGLDEEVLLNRGRENKRKKGGKHRNVEG